MKRVPTWADLPWAGMDNTQHLQSEQSHMSEHGFMWWRPECAPMGVPFYSPSMNYIYIGALCHTRHTASLLRQKRPDAVKEAKDYRVKDINWIYDVKDSKFF
jgi:hypothetical protein